MKANFILFIHWKYCLVWSIIWLTWPASGIAQSAATKAQLEIQKDETAEKMLVYQRDNGGWPQYKGDPTDYRKPITDSFKAQLINDKSNKDTKIDDRSTTLEINYLLTAFQKTNNQSYLKAAEKGIVYLLEAQNQAGGWPQFYPDTSRYHKHITYNDNAMINVLWIMKHLSDGEEAFRPMSRDLQIQAQTALQHGVQCILNTQYRQNGKLTVWCAQHDSHTLAPAPARAFEPASLSGSESVDIVRFLMSIDQPSEEIKTAVRAAITWFDQVKMPGINIKTIPDATQPSGQDRVIYEDPQSTLWARFYDLQTNEPIFTGRDGIQRSSLAEIENERRVGYGYYGKWPQKLLKKEYPAWREKWGK